MDVHRNVKGVKLKDVAEARAKDLQAQGKYGVDFQTYWLDEKEGTISCLSNAPDKEALSKAHKEAHGLVPSETFEVREGGWGLLFPSLSPLAVRRGRSPRRPAPRNSQVGTPRRPSQVRLKAPRRHAPRRIALRRIP